MVKSENSIMLTKDEFKKLSEKWKPILSAMFEVTNVFNKVVLFTDDEEKMEIYDQLAPLFSQLQNNAVNATIKIIENEFFN